MLLCIRKGERDLGTEGFPYRLMLSLLPKHVWRQRDDLRSTPHSALCMCECWGAHARWDIEGLPLLASNQEDSRCTWELWVLVTHREPFRASTPLLGRPRGPVRICSRTSRMQVHLWNMPYKLQRPYSKQGLLSVCKGPQPRLSSSPGRTIRTVFTHIYLYNPLYLS